jgi:hypothetical protein
MVGNDRLIPEGFEVHHQDKNPENDSFSNLFALSGVDHSKLNGSQLIKDEIPF